MRRAGLASGFLAAALAAACASAPKLTANEIVARNVAARGGLEAWRKVDTMVWIGRIQSAHAPAPSMQFRLAQQRPNKTRLQIVALGENTLRIFDGVHGWKLRLAHGRPDVQPYTVEEARYAQAGHGIDGPLIDVEDNKDSLSLAGLEQLGPRKAWHLKIQRSRGGDEDVWVDAETFLDLRADRVAEGPSGTQRRVSITYADYRDVEGLQIPFVVETGTEAGPGVTPDRMLIDKVMINAALDRGTFENPSGPQRAPLMPPVTAQSHDGNGPAADPGSVLR